MSNEIKEKDVDLSIYELLILGEKTLHTSGDPVDYPYICDIHMSYGMIFFETENGKKYAIMIQEI